jgi:cyclopropane-fatty-acyl-phospholipid synthase
MHYSCAYFREPQASLETAQAEKCRHIARKLCLRPGMRVLDIGCGWGSLAMHLARHEGARVTGLTLSPEQLRVAKAEADRRGLSKLVDFQLADYREHHHTYDRVVSVGMFEHVGPRNYRRYFRHLAKSLGDQGVALLHTIGSRAAPEPLNPWIRRHIFPGGQIPSLSEMAPAIEKEGLISTDIEVWRDHYALTLREWNERFQAHRGELVALKGERFCRVWELYLLFCETAFEVGNLVVWQWQLSKSRDVVPRTREYLYSEAEPASVVLENALHRAQ